MNGRRTFPSFLTASIILLSFTLTACETKYYVLPVQETKTEVMIGRPLGVQKDQIKYGRAYGPVNVLFVVDNTETASDRVVPSASGNKENLLTWFFSYYKRFTELFETSVARELDYRIQIVSGHGNVTRSYFGNQKTADSQMLEVFRSTVPQPISYLFHAMDPLHGLRPFASTLAGMRAAPLSERPHIPLFIVYLLGGDLDSSFPSETAQGLATALKENPIDSYQTQIFLISKGESSQSNWGCRFHYPSQTVARLRENSHHFSLKEIDLCQFEQNGWDQLADSLFQTIVKFKDGTFENDHPLELKYVLSRKPYRPETMRVKKVNRTYRYGEDYTYNDAHNFIQFKQQAGAQIDDSIEIEYFLPSAELQSDEMLDLVPGEKPRSEGLPNNNNRLPQ